jgi:hypothetical protein
MSVVFDFAISIKVVYEPKPMSNHSYATARFYKTVCKKLDILEAYP